MSVWFIVDCVIYLEGSITKVTSQNIGIYVSRQYQPKIMDLQGKSVRVLEIIDDCKENNTH